METYGELFRIREFAAVFVTASIRYAASTMSGLALATLVYARTGSALFSALAMFGSSFGQLIGAATVLSTADRARPRTALVVLGAGFAVANLALVIPGLPIWALLAIELGTGLLNTATGGVQWGLLTELVPPGGYILGRSIFNIAVGVTAMLGFAVGGLLIVLISARGVLLAASGLYLASALVARSGLTDRAAREMGSASIRRTWTVDKRLLSSPARRAVYLALWVPNGLIVGCEALFVPYAPHSAGVLFLAAAAGMLSADIALGRFVPRRWRRRLITPLRLLLAAPYLLFIGAPPTGLAVIAVVSASLGYGAGLLLQERLLELTPSGTHGHALGLHNAGMLAMQGLGATLAGAISEVTSPSIAIAAMAILSLSVTVALTARLRSTAPAPDDFAHSRS